MEFISTKNMKDEDAPEGEVLVKHLEPFMGEWVIAYAIAYYDNPNHYTDGNGKGWLRWLTDQPINVVSYRELPKITEKVSLNQRETVEKFGEIVPNKGNVNF